jgi:hypothetical protein
MSFATGLGWICQFHAADGTTAQDPGVATTASIAYLPL